MNFLNMIPTWHWHVTSNTSWNIAESSNWESKRISLISMLRCRHQQGPSQETTTYEALNTLFIPPLLSWCQLWIVSVGPIKDVAMSIRLYYPPKQVSHTYPSLPPIALFQLCHPKTFSASDLLLTRKALFAQCWTGYSSFEPTKSYTNLWVYLILCRESLCLYKL